jgi:hypothetical protein
MAKKPTSTAETNDASAIDPASIDPTAHYRVVARARFKAFGVGFGGLSTTEVSGALLSKILAGEHAGKVESWTAV